MAQAAMYGEDRHPAHIALIGDVMLGRLVSRELGQKPAAWFWSDVRPLLTRADAVLANLECAITEHEQEWDQSPKIFHFRADPAAIEVLKEGNIRAVSLANNHVLDFGYRGLEDTLDRLDQASIAHAGAGRNEASARAPAMLRAGTFKLALFGCVDHEAPFAAGLGRPGTAFVALDESTKSPYPDAVAIGAARKAGANFVILTCHLGPNMVLKPSTAIRAYRLSAIGNGVDIVHGHSAHLFQGVERSGQSLILHDTGDFLDDYRHDPRLHNEWSFLFLVELDKNGPRSLRLFPVILELARVRRACRKEAQAIFERMRELSRAFGTEFEQEEDCLVLRL